MQVPNLTQVSSSGGSSEGLGGRLNLQSRDSKVLWNENGKEGDVTLTVFSLGFVVVRKE